MEDPYSSDRAWKRKKCDSPDTSAVSKRTRLQRNLKNQSDSSSSVAARSTPENEGKSRFFSFFSFISRFLFPRKEG